MEIKLFEKTKNGKLISLYKGITKDEGFLEVPLSKILYWDFVWIRDNFSNLEDIEKDLNVYLDECDLYYDTTNIQQNVKEPQPSEKLLAFKEKYLG